MTEVADFETARRRIGPHVRRTPLIPGAPLLEVPPAGPARLSLKLENLQVTGSFKARGAVNRVLSLPPEQAARGLVTASGGNHGLGVAYAGRIVGAPVTIYLGANVPPAKAQKLELWGARTIWEGEVWDDADRAAQEAARRDGLTYIHAFDDPAVIAGQGTLALEILEDAPDVDLVLVSIGGGGLSAGVSTAVKALAPRVRVVGVEPVGAPTLYESLRAGHPVELPEVRTRANTLAPRRSADLNFRLIRDHVDEIVLVDDDEMAHAARWLWFEMGVASELAGAAAVAALLCGRVQAAGFRHACAVICGAGTDGLPPLRP
jgi:threonine dehydratase